MSADSNLIRFKLSMPASPEATESELAFARQLGAQAIYIWVRPEQRNYPFLRDLRAKVEDAGLELYMVGNMDVGKSPRIHLALPARHDIAAYQAFVRDLGEPASTRHLYLGADRVGAGAGTTARTRHVDLDELAKHPSPGRSTARRFVDNFPIMGRSPVRGRRTPGPTPRRSASAVPGGAPPDQEHRRLPQVLRSPPARWDGVLRGLLAEGGDEGFGNVLEGIRDFQSDGRILIVHFRNVSSQLPVFEETFLDNGYFDMYQVMKTLVESGYAGTVTYDHTPHFPPEYNRGSGQAYAMGYMQALIARAKAELGG